MTGEALDQVSLVDELTSDLDPIKARPLAQELVSDWAREADSMPDPSAVLRFQRQALGDTTARAGGDRLLGLELEVVRRRLDRLSAETFSLAQDTFDGNVDPEDSKRRGEALLEGCKQIASELDELGSNQVTDAMRRTLGESLLDALYAVERKATSQRLAHARPQSPTGGGPPTILE